MRSALPLPDPNEPPVKDVPEPERPPADQPVLFRSVKLRCPTFGEDASAREKAGRLEWFILHAAEMRGDLAELRLTASVELKSCRKRWSRLTGYETCMPKGDKTRAAVEDAKRKSDRPLAEAMDEAAWVVAQCTDEMKRLADDFEMASRAYSVISGG